MLPGSRRMRVSKEGRPDGGGGALMDGQTRYVSWQLQGSENRDVISWSRLERNQ
jgi:hypothetical protein